MYIEWATALVLPTPLEGGGQKAVWIFFALELQIHSPQVWGSKMVSTTVFLCISPMSPAAAELLSLFSSGDVSSLQEYFEKDRSLRDEPEPSGWWQLWWHGTSVPIFGDGSSTEAMCLICFGIHMHGIVGVCPCYPVYIGFLVNLQGYVVCISTTFVGHGCLAQQDI